MIGKEAITSFTRNIGDRVRGDKSVVGVRSDESHRGNWVAMEVTKVDRYGGPKRGKILSSDPVDTEAARKARVALGERHPKVAFFMVEDPQKTQ